MQVFFYGTHLEEEYFLLLWLKLYWPYCLSGSAKGIFAKQIFNIVLAKMHQQIL